MRFSLRFPETAGRHSHFTKPALAVQCDLKLLKKYYRGYTEMPVVAGSLVSDSIVIHGSDLVHNEGRIPGNHMAIFMQCTNIEVRRALIEKLEFNRKEQGTRNYHEKLVEITDAFEVRWVLSV